MPSLFIAITLFAGSCTDPDNTETRMNMGAEISEFSKANTVLEADFLNNMHLSNDRRGLCTRAVFNFLGHLVQQQRLSFLEKTPEEVISFMIDKGVIPIFHPDNAHKSGLKIHRFNYCDRHNDPLKAIRDTAQQRASLTSESFSDVQSSTRPITKQKPRTDQWATLLSKIVQLRKESFPDKVDIRKRTFREYLGKRNEEDLVIAVFTSSRVVPLATVLRLQGRIVDFFEVNKQRSDVQEMDVHYAVDSVTDAEFKLLAESGLHLTTAELETHIYSKLSSPFLTPQFDAKRNTLVSESHEAAGRSIWRTDSLLGLWHLNPDTHEGIILDQLADLNPDAKFVIALEELDSKSLETFISKKSQDIQAEFQLSLQAIVKELQKQKVSIVVNSRSTAGWKLLPEKVYPKIKNLLSIDISTDFSVHKKSDIMPPELLRHIKAETHSYETHKILKQANIQVFQAVCNSQQLGSPIRLPDDSIEHEKENVQIELIREFLKHDPLDLTTFTIGKTELPFFMQLKLYEAYNRNFTEAEILLKDWIAQLPWRQIFNWAVTDIMVDQGNAFESFENKQIGPFNASYSGIYRSLHNWEASDYGYYTYYKTNYSQYDCGDPFLGSIYVPVTFGFVTPCTSFSCPTAASWLQTKKESIHDLKNKSIYFRPFTSH